MVFNDNDTFCNYVFFMEDLTEKDKYVDDDDDNTQVNEVILEK